MIALLTPNIGTSVDAPSLAGRIISTFIAILGFGIWALPAGILATGIGKAMRDREKRAKSEEKCPDCGKSMHERSRDAGKDSAPGTA